MNQRLKDLSGDQARSFKKYSQKAGGSSNEFLHDLQFDSKKVQKFEKKQDLIDIKDQITYFGYEIEPFHMKNERDLGEIDKEGYFIQDKNKDRSINDAWLDQLDNSNVFKDIQQKEIQKSSSHIKKWIKKYNKNHQGLQSATFFKSKKHGSKQQVEEEQVDSSSEEEIQQNPDKKQQEEKQPDMYDLEPEQLKEILYDLLNDGETPTQAIKRLKSKLETKQRGNYKKNVRKSEMQVEIQQIQQEEEAKQTLNLIVDICAVLIQKNGDPGKQFKLIRDVYNIKKEPKKIIQNEEENDDIF
ncbi:hypothetical protein pb186bvf_018712 [Paramecium bursaria]